MPQDLLSFLEKIKVELSDEFITVEDEIDPAHAIAATVDKLEQVAKKRPVLLFNNVRGRLSRY